MLTKQVVFVATDEGAEEMKKLLEMMVEPSRNEPGCLLYNIYQSSEDPKTFVVIESWEDEAALKGHQNTAHYAHYKSHFEPFCARKSSTPLEILG